MEFLDEDVSDVPFITSWKVDEQTGNVIPSFKHEKAPDPPNKSLDHVAVHSPQKEQQHNEVGICRFFFENGRCLKGSNCPYSHSLAALVKSGGITRTRPIGMKTKQPQQRQKQKIQPKEGCNMNENQPPPYCFMPQRPMCFLPGTEDDVEQMFVPSQVVLAALTSPVGGQPLFVPVPVISPMMATQSQQLLSDEAIPHSEDCSQESGSVESEGSENLECSSESVDEDEEDDSDEHEQDHKVTKKVCSFFFHLGHCKKGEACGFSHEWCPGMEVPPPPSALTTDRCRSNASEQPQNAEPVQQRPMTRVTGGTHTLTGKLLESASRRFFDPVCGEDPTNMSLPRRRPPRPSHDYSPSFLASGLFRSKPCTYFFETGFCLKGDHCNFSHDPHLLLEQSRVKHKA